MYIKNTNNVKHNKALTITIIALVVIIVGVVLVIFFSKKNSENSARTTSTAPTAQGDYSGGDNRQNADSTSTQGGAVDNHGQSSSTPTDQSTWKTSDSGVITLKQPISGSTLKSGTELSGVATLDKIQYRLVDNAVGVIAQGALTVVSGGFSGTLQFQARSKTGSLAVFSFDDQGREVNRVEIPVAFQ